MLCSTRNALSCSEQHETRRSFQQRPQYYLEHTSQSSASGNPTKKHCSNLRDVSTASKIGNRGDTRCSTQIRQTHLRDTLLPRPWCSGARSLGTICIGTMLENVPYFIPGIFTLIFQIPIKAHAFCERSNSKPKARMGSRNLTS